MLWLSKIVNNCSRYNSNYSLMSKLQESVDIKSNTCSRFNKSWDLYFKQLKNCQNVSPWYK